ncbi:Asp-tRNA(Asn)/Glu-tRNA(Gln) amidotransferase subunit GatA [Segetibacter koreensis]|uniref:Asp-tRNA(Asn)/Glu-tRNA(Gln) amidotransferase subunit GatA n=1 Tax=Segetibacter koreensis TaxID=398037 RepID=UPI000377FE1C|nr:Asp-tRNA(Asn)/Glu-tRNA(Gln) amidotransferase subunit GatA [Segetibacter koreensis]
MLDFLSVKEYHTSLINGQHTCVEAVSFCLEKISATAHLNAWLEVFEAEALERADELDKARQNGQPLGKLHGVIVGLKDVICFKDHKVSASSRILEGFTSVYHATATKRLLDEGAIILGRQNCDEFAMGSSNENSAFGPVKNAIDEERVPGGSSGGSAVAVQTGSCMISLGSDTGGSVRQPADFCGIIGLKPSYGCISRYGLIAYASSFDQIGIFGKSIEDVRLVLDVIAGPDEFDSTASQKPAITVVDTSKEQKYRICYFKNALEHPSLDPVIAASIQELLQTAATVGIEIEGIDFELLDYIVPTYYVLTTAEASSNLSRYDGIKFGYRNKQKNIDLTDLYKLSRSEGFGPEVKRRILLGTFVLSEGYYDAYFTKAQQVRRLLVEKTKLIFEQFDAIILPTVPTPAYRLGEKKDPIEIFLADIYTVYANLAGIPAISLPLFKNEQGLPFGVQVMSSQHNEKLLLRLSELLMKIETPAATSVD